MPHITHKGSKQAWNATHLDQDPDAATAIPDADDEPVLLEM